MKTPVQLILVRGLPGSGKSTFARGLIAGAHEPHWDHLEADDFFVDSDGQYVFDRRLIGIAHDWCFSTAVHELRRGFNVIVSNTFTTMREINRYLGIADLVPGVDISVVQMATQYNNIHNVPEYTLKAMKDRWESFPSDFKYPIRTIHRSHEWEFIDMVDGVTTEPGSHNKLFQFKCNHCDLTVTTPLLVFPEQEGACVG